MGSFSALICCALREGQERPSNLRIHTIDILTAQKIMFYISRLRWGADGGSKRAENRRKQSFKYSEEKQICLPSHATGTGAARERENSRK
jgi:hypothetical protein